LSRGREELTLIEKKKTLLEMGRGGGQRNSAMQRDLENVYILIFQEGGVKGEGVNFWDKRIKSSKAGQ